MSSLVVILGGLNGSGKSSVVKAIKAFPQKEWNVVNIGDKMYNVAFSKGLVQNRDQMRNLPQETQKELQKEAAIKISELDGKIIVDTHYAILTPNGFLRGLPDEILGILNPTLLIHVVMPTFDIWRTRFLERYVAPTVGVFARAAKHITHSKKFEYLSNLHGRKRELSIKPIRELASASNKYFHEAAKHIGAQEAVISNRYGTKNLENAQLNFIKILNNLVNNQWKGK